MEFFEFNLSAWQNSDSEAYVMVNNSPVGGMRRPALVSSNIEKVHAHCQSNISDFFKGEHGIQQKAYDLGQELSHIIFPPQILTLLIRSLERISVDYGIRVRLCLDENLIDLPWEWAHCPDAFADNLQAGFLFLNPRISLVRETSIFSQKIKPSTRKQQLLFSGTFWQGDIDRYEMESEFKTLSETLDPVKDLLQLNFIDSSEDNIEKSLAKKATIFHYSGHTDNDNGRGYLLKEVSDNCDSSSKLYSDVLAAMLLKAGTRLAVFNACNSGRWAFIKPLANMALPAFIGIYGTVSTEAATAFCDKLYSSLAIGLSLDEAVTWARFHVIEVEQYHGRECFEWGSFMVYMPTRETTIFPRPRSRNLRDRQADTRRERQNTIINVTQMIFGPQTNINGHIEGPVLSGKFSGPVNVETEKDVKNE